MKLEADGRIIVSIVVVGGLLMIVRLLLSYGANPSAVAAIVERVLAAIVRW